MPKESKNISYSNIMRGLTKDEKQRFKDFCDSQERTNMQQLRYYIRNFNTIHNTLC